MSSEWLVCRHIERPQLCICNIHVCVWSTLEQPYLWCKLYCPVDTMVRLLCLPCVVYCSVINCMRIVQTLLLVYRRLLGLRVCVFSCSVSCVVCSTQQQQRRKLSWNCAWWCSFVSVCWCVKLMVRVYSVTSSGRLLLLLLNPRFQLRYACPLHWMNIFNKELADTWSLCLHTCVALYSMLHVALSSEWIHRLRPVRWLLLLLLLLLSLLLLLLLYHYHYYYYACAS